MESGWFGGGLTEQEQAGGDGQHLLLSWTSQEESVNGFDRYQIMLAKIEFDTGKTQSSATAPATASHTGSPPTSNAFHGENLMQAAAFATVGFGRNRGHWHGHHQYYWH